MASVGFFVASAFFFFLAMTSLPFVLIKPSSFNLYFTFGSICLQMCFCFYYGSKEYIKKLFGVNHRFFAIVYIVSLLICLYLALSGSSYFMSLGAVGLQAVTLVYFAKESWYGGAGETASQGLETVNRLNNMGVFSRLFKSEKGSSLPIWLNYSN